MAADAMTVADCGRGARISLNFAGLSTEVLAFYGVEAISTIPRYYVAFATPSKLSDPKSLVGEAGELVIEGNGHQGRFSGVASAVAAGSVAPEGIVYSVTLQTELATLSRDQDYRIQQDKDPQEIIEDVLTDRALSRYSFNLAGSYEPVEFEVQYGESSLAFLQRIAEREGIHYHFTDDGSVIFGDTNSVFTPSTVSVLIDGAGTRFGELSRFQRSHAATAGAATVRGFDSKLPSFLVEGSAPAAASGEEIYAYSPAVTRPDRATRLAELALERAQWRGELHAGAGSAAELRAGWLFDESDPTGIGLGGSYLATRVRHAALREGECFAYGNVLEAIPLAVPFRPERRTPIPSPGLATAIVTGPAGESVFVDQYGRIKVQFHWDRLGKDDDSSSAWIRVAVPAGRLLEQFIPEVGDEVLVGFLQGDPALPLGGLHNARDLPPPK